MNWQEKDLKSLSYRGVREKKKIKNLLFTCICVFPAFWELDELDIYNCLFILIYLHVCKNASVCVYM